MCFRVRGNVLSKSLAGINIVRDRGEEKKSKTENEEDLTFPGGLCNYSLVLSDKCHGQSLYRIRYEALFMGMKHIAPSSLLFELCAAAEFIYSSI